MSSYRNWLPELLTGVALLGAAMSAQAGPWFGAACPATDLSVLPLPAAAHEQLVLARLSPRDAGRDVTLLVTPDGQFWASREDFAEWRLPLPQGAPRIFDGGNWYPLEKVRGLQYRFDACTQELWMDVSAVAGVRHSYTIAPHERATPGEITEPGGHLNLDLQYLDSPGLSQVSGTAEFGAFNRYGHGSSSFLHDGTQLLRLETQWVHDWPDRTERMTVGDSITRGGQVGQALRFAGLQWGTDFTLQPDLVTFPLPSLRGRAALPSTVDVYVNQVLRAQQDVPAGSFELSNVPVMTGSGQVQLVVRDLLGRSQIIQLPFYATPSLLRAGLDEYSVQAGALREDYGSGADQYGPAFAAARLRSGISDRLTSEVYGEAAARRQMAGMGLSGVALPAGNWNFGFAASRSAAGHGLFGNLGLEHAGSAWNAALQLRLATRGFAQLGDVEGSLRQQWLARFGLPLAQYGMFNLSYLRDERRDRAGSSILAASYGTRLRRNWYLNASLTQIYGVGGGLAGALTGTLPFGGNRTFSAQTDQGPGSQSLYRVALQGDPPSNLGFGYRVAAEEGSRSRATGNARWTGEKGAATADVESLDGDNSLRLGLSSALAVLGTDLFWTRPVSSSFAVVDSGAPGVRIYQDNHLAGRADGEGLLLVPGLRAYERNSLRIEDADLPLSYAAQALSVSVVPPARSGLRAAFAVEQKPALSLFLLRANGMPVPVGARVELDGQSLDLPVGYGGQVYIEALPGRHRLTLHWSNDRCATLLTVAPDAAADQIPQTLECR